MLRGRAFLATAARAIANAELFLIVAIAPALLFPTPARLLVLAVVPVIWICARITSGRYVPRTPMNAALYLLLVMAAVSLSVAFDAGASLGKVLAVVLGALLFWGLARWAVTPQRVAMAIPAVAVAGALLGLLGLFGMASIPKFSVLDSVIARLPRMIRGVPGAEAGFNPNAVAGYLVLFVPLQIGLFVEACRDRGVAIRWPARLLYGAALFITLGATILMQSRGAWAGLLAALATCVAWHSARARLALAAAAVAGVVAIAVAPGPILGAALSGRLEIWSRAVYAIGDFPITGVGMNNFRSLVPALYPPFLTSPDFELPNAHNQFLQAAVDLGIPGLIAFLALWIIAGVLLVQAYRAAAERRFRVLAAGLGLGLVAHFVFGLTDAITLGTKPGVLFWLILGLAVALHRVTAAPPAARPG